MHEVVRRTLESPSESWGLGGRRSPEGALLQCRRTKDIHGRKLNPGNLIDRSPGIDSWISFLPKERPEYRIVFFSKLLWNLACFRVVRQVVPVRQRECIVIQNIPHDVLEMQQICAVPGQE